MPAFIKPRWRTAHQGNDRLLFGSIMRVVAFWLFAQTTFNMAPDMRRDLGLDASTMNVAVAVTSLLSGIFIVVAGGLAGCGTVKPAGGPGGVGLGHLQNGFVARCGGLRRLFHRAQRRQREHGLADGPDLQSSTGLYSG